MATTDSGKKKTNPGVRNVKNAYSTPEHKASGAGRGAHRPSASAHRKSAKRKKRKSTIDITRLIPVIAVLAAVALVIVLAVKVLPGLLSANRAAEVTTLTFEKDGTLTLEEIEDLTAGGYSTDEAKEYAEQEIENYNTGATGQVKLVKFRTTDSGAYMKTTYDSCSTYTEFTGYAVTRGTVGDYVENEGTFSDIYASVTDGVKGDIVSASDFTDDADLKLIIIAENITVRVDGTIRYVSNTNTTVTAADTVTIAQADGNDDQESLTYIIYE